MGHRHNLSAKNRIDFIGIGAGKSGTTWLVGNLHKHPGTYVPARKYNTAFAKFFYASIERLEGLFDSDLSIWRITSVPGKKDRLSSAILALNQAGGMYL